MIGSISSSHSPEARDSCTLGAARLYTPRVPVPNIGHTAILLSIFEEEKISKMLNVFVLIGECICPDYKVDLSKSQNTALQLSKNT